MARTRYKIFDNDHPYFLTCTIIDWLPLLTDTKVIQIILDSMKFMQCESRMRIFAYVIMENHMHVIASSDSLSEEIRKFKSFTARSIIDFYKQKSDSEILKKLSLLKCTYKKDRAYQFWQEGSHPQQIGSLEMMQQKVDYIHYNPVRSGHVEEPEEWQYSSAKNYAGMEGLIDVSLE